MAHGEQLAFTNVFIYKIMHGQTWPKLDMCTGIAVRAFLVSKKLVHVDNSLANPPDVYRVTMNPQTVHQHWTTQHELIDALCDLLRWPQSTKDWLLKQVQWHDPTLPKSGTRQRRHVADALKNDGVPSLYQIVLNWAANFGNIEGDIMRALRKKDIP